MGYLTNNLLGLQAVADEILYTDYRLDEFLHDQHADLAEGATRPTVCGSVTVWDAHSGSPHRALKPRRRPPARAE